MVHEDELEGEIERADEIQEEDYGRVHGRHEPTSGSEHRPAAEIQDDKHIATEIDEGHHINPLLVEDPEGTCPTHLASNSGSMGTSRGGHPSGTRSSEPSIRISTSSAPLESTASEAVAGLTLISANYDEAVATLKHRQFNRHIHLEAVTSPYNLKGLRQLFDAV